MQLLYPLSQQSTASPFNDKDTFWLDDPRAFFTDTQHMVKIIPDQSMTLVEQLNTVFRFALYFSIVVIFVRQNITALFFAFFIAFFTIVIRYYDTQKNVSRKKVLEHMNVKDDPYSGHCIKPTPDNPFMNVKLSDYKQFPNRPPACDITKPSVKKKVHDAFYKGKPQDIEDIYDKRMNDRQFYTMPSTQIPNDQKQFAEWLYKRNDE